MSDPTTPDVIIPPAPPVLDYAAMLNDANAKVADLEAKLAGADQARAAAVLERDAARQALDVAAADGNKPCRVCGTTPSPN